MNTKLQEIKQRLSNYDAFVEQYPNTTMTALDALVGETLPDDFRLLLAVVEAATQFYREAMQHGDLPEVSDETQERLNVALKAISDEQV